MSPVHIRTRIAGDGTRRYSVIYRIGGRGYKQHQAGTFRTLKDARTRRDLVSGWLAGGRDPSLELAAMLEPARRRTIADTYDAWMRSRHDVGPKRHEQYQQARVRIIDFFGADKDPTTISRQDCREFVGYLAEHFAASTVRSYYHPFAMALEFIDIDPNPARHRSVKMPRLDKTEPIVMSGKQFQAMLERLPVKWRLFFRVLEATGMRIGELLALQWGDIDFAEQRLRVSVARTKGRSGGQRWVQLPGVLLEEIAGLVPFEDRRTERAVFPKLNRDGAKNAMGRACDLAGVPHFTPHSLRHRRLSLWHMQGVPAVELARRAGHTKPAMTLSVYSHVMVDAKDDEWLSSGPGGEPNG